MATILQARTEFRELSGKAQHWDPSLVFEAGSETSSAYNSLDWESLSVPSTRQRQRCTTYLNGGPCRRGDVHRNWPRVARLSTAGRQSEYPEAERWGRKRSRGGHSADKKLTRAGDAKDQGGKEGRKGATFRPKNMPSAKTEGTEVRYAGTE